ncbi:MAG: hypothetical protein EXQ86_02745 [Rhodospirillales bacterium]|nr:hypothetical protein [Rhodospirillales bacterium]
MSVSGAGPRHRPWTSRWSPAVAIPALLVLGACEVNTAPVKVAAESPPPPVVTPGTPVAAESRPRTVPAPETSPELAARPPAASPALPPTLLGMSREDVTELLGPPTFRRREAPAEIWQYRAPSCTLDLFLYKDAKGDGYKVAHVEAREKNAAKIGPSDCLGRFIAPERKPRAG